MTEDDARDWLLTHFPTAMPKLERFVALLRDEAGRQNLIAPSTLASIWARHIVDSAQLQTWSRPGHWLDIGSGAGLPGIVLAILRPEPMQLVEPRRRRVDFLLQSINALDLRHCNAAVGKVQAIGGSYDIVSARAVAPLDTLLGWTVTIVSRETRFVLPRGQSAREDVEIAQRAWHGRFHVEQSLTDPQSGIVIADGVHPR